ncbi:MAG: tetratricopeptide repeat protein [Verrucomicrobia bacterium]|nr:tetratricopeptide repeat protein [Verrucomicrobiota bacterium]
MRKIAVILLLLGAISSLTPTATAAPARDASDLFLRAYMQIQEGDAAKERSDWKTAEARYQDALNILKDIETAQPDWNPHIVNFRKHYCEQNITDARNKAAGITAPPKTATAPAAPSSAPATAPAAATPMESNVVRDLASEVERLRQEVQRMQTERAATPPPTPVPMPSPAAGGPDTDKVRQLHAELTDARRQIQQLLAEKSQQTPPVPVISGDAQKVRELNDQMTTLRSQLQQMLAERAQWEQSRQELARLQTERSSLLRQLQDKDARLAAGPAALDQATPGVRITPEQMAQHARALDAVRSENKQLALKLASAERDAREQTAKVAELTPLTGQIAATKAEIDRIKQQLNVKTEEADKAETRVKELTPLEKAAADLRLELKKSQALLDTNAQTLKDNSEQIARFKTDLNEARTQLSQAGQKSTTLQQQAQDTLKQLDSLRRELEQANGRATNNDMQRLAAAKEVATLRAALDSQKEEVRKLAAGSTADREKLAQAETLKQKLADTEKLAGDREKDKATLVRENAMLRASLDSKVEEMRKMAAGAAGPAMSDADREKLAQADALKQKLADAEKLAASREKDRATLIRENALLRASLDSKDEAVRKMAAAAPGSTGLSDADRDKLAQAGTLKRRLDDAERLAADREKERLQLARETGTLRTSLDQKNEELRRALGTVATASREKGAQAEELRRKLAEAEKQAGERESQRLMIAKENAVLRAAVDQKTGEYQKLLATGAASRSKEDALEKTLRDLEKKLAVFELARPKLSAEEEEFLKKTEVLVRPPSEKGMSGEINAHVRRAKERALAQAAALNTAAGVPTPAPTLAQANTTGSNVVSDAPSSSRPPSAAAVADPGKPGAAGAKLPPDLKALVDEARELYNEKKLDAAAAKYRELLKRDPENLIGLSNLAVIRFQQERMEEAEHLLTRALTAAPEDAYSHSLMGIIHYRQHRNDEAIEALTKAVKLNPENAEAHNYLGIACWQKGWRSAAEQELRRALELKPDYADAHYNLAVVYATQKPPFLGLAKFHYRKTVELGRPRDPALERIFAGEPAPAEKKP